MKFRFLYFLLLGILMFLSITIAYPVSKYGAQYAQLIFPSHRLCIGGHLLFADSRDSSSGYRKCIFQMQPSKWLTPMPQALRQRTNILAMKTPRVPSFMTLKPGVRIHFVGAAARSFLKIPSPHYCPRLRTTSTTFRNGKELGSVSHPPGNKFPTVTRGFSVDTTKHATFYTTKMPRGDA